MMNKVKKFIAIVLVCVLILNLFLVAMNIISLITFWLSLAVISIYLYFSEK